MNEMTQYDEYKEDWLKKHPSSIPAEESEDSPYPGWARPAIFAGFAIAALLSGVHTMLVVYNGIPLSPLVDEMMRQWVARGSFVVYELGMFAAAFLMTVESTKALARSVLTIIFITLIVTNLYSVLQTYGFDLQHNLVGAAVTALFSLVPVIAYGLGKFYINIANAERILRRRGKENYREAMKQLDAVILREYTKYLKESQKAVHEIHSLNSVNERPAGDFQSLNSPNGYSKQMNSRQIIAEFFSHHPEFNNMTLDQLNEAIERETGIRVGRTSIHNVRKEWQNRNDTNGRRIQ